MSVSDRVARGAVEFVAAKSTLPAIPYPAPEERGVIRTERLLLRELHDDDMQALYEIRSDPAVAEWTSTGKPDASIEETKKLLEPMRNEALERQDRIICLASTGQVIGFGGSHRRCGSLGWPEIGYSLKKEFWGQGLGTEFLQAFLKYWWALPRAEYDLSVDRATIPNGDTVVPGSQVPECIVGITVEENKASRNVLSKGGLELARLLPVDDLRDGSKKIDLFSYSARRPQDAPN